MQETAGASDVSEEVMTRSRMCFFVVSREVNVLTKIERRKKRQKLRDESVCRIIEMNVECSFHLKGELIGYMALFRQAVF